MRTRSRLADALPCLVLLLLVQLCPPGPPAVAAPALLEELRYRIEVLAWQDAFRVRITLNRVGPDRFEAELIGESLGIFKTLSGGHRERLLTEMVWRNHQLLPLIYREESWRWGKRRLKEYRFDYDAGRLVLWEWHKGKGLTKKWQGDLATQVYDPLSAFYNIRLGLIGPNRAGETSAIPAIPYPQPGTMEVRLGSDPRLPPQGRDLPDQPGLPGFPGASLCLRGSAVGAATGLDHHLRLHHPGVIAAGKCHHASQDCRDRPPRGAQPTVGPRWQVPRQPPDTGKSR